MASTSGVCNSYKQEIFEGIHQASDSYYCALYTTSASLSNTVTGYTNSLGGEVSPADGSGYTTGGQLLTGYATNISGNTAYLTFTSPSWANTTFSNVSAALIYNSSRLNGGGNPRTVAVLTFTATSTTNGTFTVVLPAEAITLT